MTPKITKNAVGEVFVDDEKSETFLITGWDIERERRARRWRVEIPAHEKSWMQFMCTGVSYRVNRYIVLADGKKVLVQKQYNT